MVMMMMMEKADFQDRKQISQDIQVNYLPAAYF